MMARKVFYSFHHQSDGWRAAQIRRIHGVDGNVPVSEADWEKIIIGGDDAIGRWIGRQLACRSCTVVLIGSQTAGRKWIRYEIEKSWNDRKGLLGIYIHNLKDENGNLSAKGINPFDLFHVGKDNAKLSSLVNTYDPLYSSSSYALDFIRQNLAGWVEEAIRIREVY